MRAEYDILYARRNVVVHGMYDGHLVTVDGIVLHGSTKPDRVPRSGSERYPFTQLHLREEELWGLVLRADALATSALDAIGDHRGADR